MLKRAGLIGEPLLDSVREVELLVAHLEVQVQVQDSQELYLILREDLLPDHVLVELLPVDRVILVGGAEVNEDAIDFVLLRRVLDSLHDLLDVHLGAAVRDESDLVLVEVPLEVVQELPVEPKLYELDHRAQYD